MAAAWESEVRNRYGLPRRVRPVASPPTKVGMPLARISSMPAATIPEHHGPITATAPPYAGFLSAALPHPREPRPHPRHGVHLRGLPERRLRDLRPGLDVHRERLEPAPEHAPGG